MGFTFTKVVVGDLDAQCGFYVAVLGLSAVHRMANGEGAEKHEQVVLRGDGEGPSLVLVAYSSREVPVPGEAVLGFEVADVDVTVHAAVEAGGSVRVAPKSAGGSRVAVVLDPEGHAVELLQKP